MDIRINSPVTYRALGPIFCLAGSFFMFGGSVIQDINDSWPYVFLHFHQINSNQIKSKVCQCWPTNCAASGPPTIVAGGPTSFCPSGLQWHTSNMAFGGPTSALQVACHWCANVGPPTVLPVAHLRLSPMGQRHFVDQAYGTKVFVRK